MKGEEQRRGQLSQSLNFLLMLWLELNKKADQGRGAVVIMVRGVAARAEGKVNEDKEEETEKGLRD